MMFVVLEDKSPRGRGNAMNKFIEKLGKQVEGVLAGFDRLVFRGTLRRIVYDAGMKSYLWQNQVLLKDFGKHVERTSQQLKAASLTAAQQAGRPVRYLPSSQVSKEQIAREIAAKDQVRQGTVCVLTRRGTLLELRGGAQPGNQATGTDRQTSQVPVPLSLLDAPRVRIHERTHPNLVSLLHSDLSERTGVVGAADGSGGNRLPAARPLLQSDRRLRAGAAVDGRAVARELAAPAGWSSQSTQPDP